METHPVGDGIGVIGRQVTVKAAYTFLARSLVQELEANSGLLGGSGVGVELAGSSGYQATLRTRFVVATAATAAAAPTSRARTRLLLAATYRIQGR